METSRKVLLTEESDGQQQSKKEQSCCNSKEKKCCSCIDVLTAVAWVFVFQAISIGLAFLFNGDPSWMRHLKQSKLTPPGYVFGIVWPILYTLLALFQWFLSRRRKDPELNNLYFVGWLQMAINWCYVPVFFYFHLLVSAELCLILMVGLTGYMVARLWIMNKYRVSLLLIPYLLWCTFATYLSTVIIILN